MSELFADSFVFFAMLNRHDRKHNASVAALNRNRQPLVSTAWILTELADGLCAAASRSVYHH